MPSEIIALQLGQCENQSLYLMIFCYCVKLLSFFKKTQSVSSFERNFVPNMESVLKESWKTLPLKE